MKEENILRGGLEVRKEGHHEVCIVYVTRHNLKDVQGHLGYGSCISP